ncbi:MAG TPA: FAD-dependent oxidoreductase [Burkholderiales bacterium]|nr:FAD-dependent oxidoreductase [Burkholderiales bacterium]
MGVVRPAQRTPVPGLYLAGDYTANPYPATLEAAVRSGIACARMVLAPVG